MPSIVTHYLFSEDVLKKTKKEIQQDLKKSQQLYNIFAQSFDNLFYYNFFSIKSGKAIRKLGIDAQRIHCQEYFKNIITFILEHNLQSNSDVLAYLYGSLTHYILDSNCHPFVIYHAGFVDRLSKENKIYKGLHEKIEVGIDAFYYQEKRNESLYKASLGDILLPKQILSEELKDVLNQVYEKTFQVTNMGNIYEKSIKDGHTIIKYFVTDHFGIKKLAYSLFDIIFFINSKKYQNLSFYIPNPDETFLNRDHHEWCSPIDNSHKSTESFDDLYQKALQETLEIFEATYLLINNKLKLTTYLNLLKDKSYVTGQDWHKEDKIMYFDPNLKLTKKNHE